MAMNKRSLTNDRRGVAAAEFALVSVIVATMMVGVLDFGLWIWQRMQLESALLSGAHYAQQFPSDTAGITSAIVSSIPPGLYNDGKTTVAAPSLSFDCGNPNVSGSTSTACPGQRTFVQLQISRPFAPMYFTAIPNIEVSYVIRVQ